MSLEILKGIKILKGERIHDYYQITFEQGIYLNIYNSCTWPSHSLKNTVVLDIIENKEKIIFIFDNQEKLSVDMRDSAYNGPEALTLQVAGQPLVVWT